MTTDRSGLLGDLWGVPIVVSEHVPEGVMFMVGDFTPTPQPTKAAKVDTRTDVERWMAVSPREHARRIVAEVIEEHRRAERSRRDLAAFRARVMLGISQRPSEFRAFTSPA
jgi:hypothetical protein